MEPLAACSSSKLASGNTTLKHTPDFSAFVSRKIRVVRMPPLIRKKGNFLGLMFGDTPPPTHTHICAQSHLKITVSHVQSRSREKVLDHNLLAGLQESPGVRRCVLLALLATTVARRQDVPPCPLPETPAVITQQANI